MIKLKQVFLAAVLSAGLSFQAVAQSYGAGGVDYGEEPSAGVMMVDGLLVRPLTLGFAAIGLIGWVVTLPFSIPGGNAGEMGEAWVSAPVKYAFMRPLGEMEENTPPRYETDESK